MKEDRKLSVYLSLPFVTGGRKDTSNSASRKEEGGIRDGKNRGRQSRLYLQSGPSREDCKTWG